MDVPGFAFITGAASGIGKACALAFAKEGSAGIAITDTNHAALLATQAEIEALPARSGPPPRVLVHTLNVTDEAAVHATVQAVVAAFGRLDYVVHSAGIAFPHTGGTPALATRDWQRVLDINLTGSFLVLRAAVEVMLRQEPSRSAIDGRPVQRGSIVCVASIMALNGSAHNTPYTASKHAVLGLVKSVSEDHARDGIRVNAICPGPTETPMVRASPELSAGINEMVAATVPMARLAATSEIADGVLYLAGGRGSYVTGTGLLVDGGFCQR